MIGVVRYVVTTSRLPLFRHPFWGRSRDISYYVHLVRSHSERTAGAGVDRTAAAHAETTGGTADAADAHAADASTADANSVKATALARLLAAASATDVYED